MKPADVPPAMQRLMRRLGASVETTEAVAAITCEECESISAPRSVAERFKDLLHIDGCKVQLLDETPATFCIIICAAAGYTVVYMPHCSKSLTLAELERCFKE